MSSYYGNSNPELDTMYDGFDAVHTDCEEPSTDSSTGDPMYDVFDEVRDGS